MLAEGARAKVQMKRRAQFERRESEKEKKKVIAIRLRFLAEFIVILLYCVSSCSSAWREIGRSIVDTLEVVVSRARRIPKRGAVECTTFFSLRLHNYAQSELCFFLISRNVARNVPSPRLP